MGEGDWAGGKYTDLGPSGAIAAADYALSRFSELGARVPKENRLLRARRLMRRVNDRSVRLSEDDPRLLREVAEAQWTCLDFYLVARATGKNVSPDHMSKITLALGGSDLPEDDRNHLHRNTAFELVVAAFLTMGDVPVVIEEPDLQIWLGERVLGVAAKRVQGAGAIRSRMKEASEQIAASATPGIVAINADVILLGVTPVGNAEEKGQTVDEYLAEVHRADDELVPVPHLAGRIAFGRTAQWTFVDGAPSLTQDLYRQYRVYHRYEGEGEPLVADFERAEALIEKRFAQL